jgi:hypothetical protein
MWMVRRMVRRLSDMLQRMSDSERQGYKYLLLSLPNMTLREKGSDVN